jgi:hypothetical protein
MLCLGLSLLFIALFVIGIAIRSNNIFYGMVWDMIGLVSFLLLVSTIVLSLTVLRKPTKRKVDNPIDRT